MVFKIKPRQQRESFYAAALAGLRALDGRERRPRRFGPDADARWQNFCGHLSLAERVDLLIRDAAVTWQAAFSPAIVFRLPYLASDSTALRPSSPKPTVPPR